MKFNVHHITKLFYQYRDWFLLAPFGLFILFIAFGFTVDDYIPTLIVFGLISLCIVIFLLMLILHIIEIVTGAKIIIGNDHVEIRRLLRLRRKIPFTEIEEVRYTHEMIPVHTHRGGSGSAQRLTRPSIRIRISHCIRHISATAPPLMNIRGSRGCRSRAEGTAPVFFSVFLDKTTLM